MGSQGSLSSHGAASAVQPADFDIGRLFWRIHEAVVVAGLGVTQAGSGPGGASAPPGERGPAGAASGTILLWNPASERLFGYSAAEVVGQPLDVIVPPALRARHRAGLSRFLATGHGRYIDAQTVLELPARHKDGSSIAIDLSLSRIDPVTGPAEGSEAATATGPWVLAVIRDASERQRAEAARAAAEAAEQRLAVLVEENARLYRAVQQELAERTAAAAGARRADARLADQAEALARSEERERIAMDMHDGVIQSLYAVSLGLGARARLLKRERDGDDLPDALQEAMAQLDEVIQEVRDYIVSLQPRPPGHGSAVSRSASPDGTQRATHERSDRLSSRPG